MKKLLISAAAAATGFCVFSSKIHAETYPTTATNWNVTFTGDKLDCNFTTGTIQESIQGMQPGDDANFEIHLNNRYNLPVDWYMENEVIKSFEDQTTATGGAYTYTLTYYPTNGAPNILYDSNTVGGEDNVGGIGLHEATSAFEDEYLYLERIPSGGQARIVLHIALDGETQINNYQDTEAIVDMQFAVELPKTEPDSPKPSSGRGKRYIFVPNTSDPFKALPYMISGGISLALFIACAVILKRTKEDK